MITIRPDQLGAYMKTWTKAKQEAMVSGIQKAAARCEGLVKVRTSQISPHAPVHTGRYKSSWKYEARRSGDVVAALFNEAPYAGIIEYGVRPGRIPLPYRRGGGTSVIPALLRWAELKFRGKISREMGKGGPRGKTRRGIVNLRAYAIAVAIQRKLHFKGIAGKHVLGDAAFVRRMADVTRQEVRIALSKPTGRGP